MSTEFSICTCGRDACIACGEVIEVSDNDIQVVVELTTNHPVAYKPERATVPYLPSYSPHFADKDAAETDLS